MAIPSPTGWGTRPLPSVCALRNLPSSHVNGTVRKQGLSKRPCRLVVRAESNVPTPNAAVRAVNRIKRLVDDTPALSNAKKRLWGWAAGTYDDTEVRSKIEKLIKTHKVVVFSATFSLFSIQAKNLLEALGAKAEYVELDKMEGKEGVHFFHELSKMTGRASVPQIFIGGKSYGGCLDGPGVVPLYEDGSLQKILKKAGAL